MKINILNRDLTSTGSTGSWEPVKFQQGVPGTHPEIAKNLLVPKSFHKIWRQKQVFTAFLEYNYSVLVPSLAHLCILLCGFFCEVGVGGQGVMGEGHLNFQMGTRPEKSLVRSLYYLTHLCLVLFFAFWNLFLSFAKSSSESLLEETV